MTSTSDPPNVTMAPSNVTMATCSICHDEASANEMHGCKDHASEEEDLHFMCSTCFLAYANQELSGGSFEGVRYFNGDSSSHLVSRPGNLPCPHFVTGNCEVASIPLTTLFRVLQGNEETAKKYYLASQRVMYLEYEQDRQAQAPGDGEGSSSPDGGGDNAAERETDEAVVEAIRVRVLAALDKGALVRCPQCRQPGIKNAHCIHIRCHLCSTSWCYCCGRTRESEADNAIRCRGCDSIDSRIEMQPPDWNTFAIGTETPAYGALHEFHRRRQAYFVQDVKMSTTPYQWQAFRAAYPTIFKDVPTPGRRIRYDELESPIHPPVFGNTREEDLLWAIQPRVTESTEPDEGENSAGMTPQGNDSITPPVTLSQIICSSCFLLALIIILAVTGAFVGLLSNLYWNIAIHGVCAKLVFDILLFLILRMADYFEENPDTFFARIFPEVMFVGRRHLEGGEGPYYSASGRWRHNRRTRIGFVVFFFVYGCALLSLSSVTNSLGIMAGGLFFLIPTVNVVVLQACILNIWPLPPTDAWNIARPIEFSVMMGRLRFFQVFFIGVSAVSIPFGLGQSPVGVFFLLMGIGSTTAELLPRILSDNFLVQSDERIRASQWFWNGVVVLVYCLWYYVGYSKGTSITAVIVGPIVSLLCWEVWMRKALCPRQPTAEPAAEDQNAEEEVDVEGQPENQEVEVQARNQTDDAEGGNWNVYTA